MILSDVDLLERLKDGSLVVNPIEDLDTQVQPASIDMRLGNNFITFNRANITCIHPNNEEEIEKYTEEKTISDDEEFILHPGDFILAETKEWVEIPNDLVASVEGRSSLGRLAVVVHATAGWIDSGFRGHITLELSNLGVAPVALTPGMRVAQLVVETLKTPCERPYGSDRDSKYQDQSGPAASQIKEDVEFKNQE